MSAKDPCTYNDIIPFVLEDDLTLIYIEFLKQALNLFTDFNTFFEANALLFNALKSKVQQLITTCAKSYMRVEDIESMDPTELDPFNEAEYLPDHEIYLGQLES